MMSVNTRTCKKDVSIIIAMIIKSNTLISALSEIFRFATVSVPSKAENTGMTPLACSRQGRRYQVSPLFAIQSRRFRFKLIQHAGQPHMPQGTIAKNLPNRDFPSQSCRFFIYVSFPSNQSLSSSPFSCSFWISGKAESIGFISLCLILLAT